MGRNSSMAPKFRQSVNRFEMYLNVDYQYRFGFLL